MNRKSSKAVSLVLITAALASCSRTPNEQEEQEQEQKVYMRADSSAPYTDVTEQYSQQRQSSGGMGSALLWYMAFRPLMGGGMGYASNGLSHQANVGTNNTKSQAVKTQKSARGGFGNTAKAQSASS